MILVIEAVLLCIAFTIMVYILSRNPLATCTIIRRKSRNE